MMPTDVELLEQTSRGESHVSPTRYRLVDLDAACVTISSTHLILTRLKRHLSHLRVA